MSGVVVLNADYSYLNSVSWKRAIRLIVKGKAESLKDSTREVITTGGKKILVPALMRLIKIVRNVYRNRVPFSKKNIHIRDGGKCMYCGVTGERLTIDHVIPRSKGGKTSWDNCVASCKKCNATKADRTPSEAKMSLIKRPYQPTINEFLMIKMRELGVDKIIEELMKI